MDFIDHLKQFSNRVKGLKDTIATEEATKTSLIMPFFAMLGYDVFNPNEFVPEFTADVGIKKGEKVDYAILIDGVPTILIEAKSVSEQLDRHGSQLFRYFGTTDARFGILTNGIIYRFYTDLVSPNKMDDKPFLEINLEDIKDAYVPELKKFTKAAFDPETIFDSASKLKYVTEFKAAFAKELQNPSDAFVKYFLNSVYTGKNTAQVIEKFRPLLKQSLAQYISDSMNEKIKSVLDDGNGGEPSVETVGGEVEEKADKTPKIITTQEELEAYFIVKNLLKEFVPKEDIAFKDNESYMGILYQNKTTKWICRFYFDRKQKYITIADENKREVRHDINGIYEIENYKDELAEALRRYIK